MSIGPVDRPEGPTQDRNDYQPSDPHLRFSHSPQ
jgi:hypothetical protein